MQRTGVDTATSLDNHVPGASVCRHCAAPLRLTMVDLGASPLCQSLVPPDRLERMEPYYPLHVRVCTECWLAQLPQVVAVDEIFVEYGYFSAYSDSWVEHSRGYVEMITRRLGLRPDDLVIEIGANDGYLLQHFVNAGVPVLGIDPAANVAEAAALRRVPMLTEFFGLELAERLRDEGNRPRLVLGNNVLAQVPDINDFAAGVKALLAEDGTATFEFPHLATLIAGLEFDTIYHEHFSYFSLHSIRAIFGAVGLDLVDVDRLPTHGGSLRVYLSHEQQRVEPSAAVTGILEAETALRDPGVYARFARDVQHSRWQLLETLIDLKRRGKQVVGYGAPGKGNTLLNYCGIRTDLVDYTVDRNVYKQGNYTPGAHIPIYAPERITETKPDVILVLPWNLKREIGTQLAHTSEWGATLMTAIPVVRAFAPGDPGDVAVAA